MKIYESCVSSEDIKYMANADEIFFAYQEGYGPFLMKKNKTIGVIDIVDGLFLGSDLIIKGITIYDDSSKSTKLTSMFKGKILIHSKYKDNIH